MRPFLRGLVAGVILSCLRAPLGIDLFQWPAVGARVAYGWRAAALVAVAIGLWLARQSSLPSRFLIGAASGFALHALLFANAWSPAGALALAATAGAGSIVLAVLRPSPAELADEEPAPRFLEMLGLACAGAGAALALEGIARHVRLFGGGLSQDDSVSALALLAALSAGAMAFGWVAAARWLRRLSAPAGLAAGASACFVSLVAISRLSVDRTFGPYLRRFGLDTSLHGTLRYDALISAVCFVAPALVLGAALPGARGRSRIFSLLIGAAVGLCLVPGLLALAPGSSASDAQASSAELVGLGSLTSAGGALLAILSLADRGALARWMGIGFTVAVALPALLVKVEPLHVLSPWSRRPTFPSMVSDTPEGLMTVESFGLLGGSWLFVTLDRRLVSPMIEGSVADSLRLRGSVELLPAERRTAGNLKVLLVGQLTPERARILSLAGVTRIDRTAPWFEAMARIEETLWSALPEKPKMPEGEVLAPARARARLAEGGYDLVIAPAVPGDVPRLSEIQAPATTTVVRWLEIDQPAQNRDLGEQVALTCDGFERPALGIPTNAARVSGDDVFAPILLRAGAPRPAPTPITWLRKRGSERSEQRTDPSRAAMVARLAEAARGGPFEDLTAGLELFYGAQRESSGFESPEERSELPDDCLDRLRAAALIAPEDPFVRRIFETAARILAGKRWTERIYTYVEPVAQKHPPWPELEKVLARADLDSLEPAEAIRRLEPLTSTSPQDFEVWDLLGQAHCAKGDAQKALECWRRAVWLKTPDPKARRRVTLALARSGDAEGLEAARQLLLELPADEDLKALAQQTKPSGPAADPCPR